MLSEDEFSSDNAEHQAECDLVDGRFVLEFQNKNWKEGVSMDATREQTLERLAIMTREGILRSVYGAKAGHPGGSLSAADILTYLYFDQMKIDPLNPHWKFRDRFVLSKGHTAPALYSVLALRGYFPQRDLPTLRHIDSYLQGHPNMNTVPGVDMSTGSLGQGLSTGAGMALGLKLQGQDENVYVMVGDGEIEEGQIWEAVLFAHQFQLDNLCVIVDVNGLQLDGPTETIMDTYPIADKFRSFGWNVKVIDGHDFNSIEEGFNDFEAQRNSKVPTVLLAKTIKGKGISYMENRVEWHGKAPNEEQFNQGMAELAAARERLEAIQS